MHIGDELKTVSIKDRINAITYRNIYNRFANQVISQVSNYLIKSS